MESYRSMGARVAGSTVLKSGIPTGCDCMEVGNDIGELGNRTKANVSFVFSWKVTSQR